MSSEIFKLQCMAIVEARAIIKRKGKALEKKGHVWFQTGYGPSGFAQVLNSLEKFVEQLWSFRHLKKFLDIPVTIFTFSDDMDGLRKVPENIPNSDILEKNLNKPLTAVPDPFEKFPSFGEHNNAMLKKFLDKFNFNYEFKSSTQMYKSGEFK